MSEDFKLPKNPLDLFNSWYTEYCSCKPIEPTAMTLATCTKEGRPSVRTVLFKSFDDSGFVFFTNFLSHKSVDLESNPQAELLFFWEPLIRQVRIYGKVEKVTKAESDSYFQTRPYLSQIGAWASLQSQKIESRNWLMKRFEDYQNQFPEGKVPRPKNWGGYRLKPIQYEFWLGKENRLHDRFLYERHGMDWSISRLSP